MHTSMSAVPMLANVVFNRPGRQRWGRIVGTSVEFMHFCAMDPSDLQAATSILEFGEPSELVRAVKSLVSSEEVELSVSAKAFLIGV